MSDAPEPPIFRLEVRAADLRRMVDVLDVLTSEVRLDVRPDGIRCAAVDPSHVSILVARFDPSLFLEYHVDRPGTVGVDAVRIGELLKIPRGEPSYKRTPAKDAVFSLTLGRADDRPEPPNRLIARLTTPTGATITRTMPVVDASAITDPKVPALARTITAAGVDAEAFARAVKDARKVSAEGTLRRDREGLVLHATAEDRRGWPGASGAPPAETSTGIGVASVAGAGRASFPLDFLEKIAGAIKRADGLTLAWARELPLTASFRWGAEDRPTIEGRFLLAARADDDGDDADTVADRVAGWYSWAMRIRERAEPFDGAASVDLMPDDVVAAELARVDALNADNAAYYAEQTADYPARLEAHSRVFDAYRKEYDDAVSRWRAEHPRSKKRGPPRRWLPHSPGPAPPEPRPPLLAEPFDNTPAHRRDVPDRERRRSLRGRLEAGTSWGPARPEPAEPAREVEVPALGAPAAEPEPPFMGTFTPSVAYAMARGVTPEAFAEARAEIAAEDAAESQALDVLDEPGDGEPIEIVPRPADRSDSDLVSAAEAGNGRTDGADGDGCPVGQLEGKDRVGVRGASVSVPDPGRPEVAPASVDGVKDTGRLERVADLTRRESRAGRKSVRAVVAKPGPARPGPEVFHDLGKHDLPRDMSSGSEHKFPERQPAVGTDCGVCHGQRTIYSRRFEYTCPACGPQPPARLEAVPSPRSPVASSPGHGWFADLQRQVVLWTGRDGS